MKNKNLRQGNGKSVSELKLSLKKEKIKPRTKKHFKKILVPLDDSKKSLKALDQSIILASKFESLIVLIYAIPIIRVGDARLAKKVVKDMKNNVKIKLDKGKRLCQKYGINVRTKILHGEPGDIIVKYANSKKFDLVVMGSSGKGVVKEIFLGSVSNHVVHSSKVPILIIK